MDLPGELLWPETNTKQLVAVKVLKENVSHEIREDFEREVEIMSAFDHDNILKLVGVVTQNAGQSPYMIFEYMVHGDLAELLRKDDPSSLHQDSSGIIRLLKPDLVDIATQIANGMRYLTSQHFVHRDLATRNCLVGDGLVVKISDFGMSRDIYTCDYYKIGGSRMLPVRWMSPESVKYGRFTSESDVWAYGVVLWEIFSSGRQPYYGHSNEEVVRFLDAGILLQRPEDCPSTIYHIMLGCWKADPKERHSFDKIHKHLQDYHERLVKMAAASLPTTPVASQTEIRTETPPATSSSPEPWSKSPPADRSGFGSKPLLDAWFDPLSDCNKASSLVDCNKSSLLADCGKESFLKDCNKASSVADCNKASLLVDCNTESILAHEKKTSSLADCNEKSLLVDCTETSSWAECKDSSSLVDSHKASSLADCDEVSPLLPQPESPQNSPSQNLTQNHIQSTTDLPPKPEETDDCVDIVFQVKLPPAQSAAQPHDDSTHSSTKSSPCGGTDFEETVVQLEDPSPSAAECEGQPSSVVDMSGADMSGMDSGFNSGEQAWNRTDVDTTTPSLSVDTGVESLSQVVCTEPTEIV